MGFAVMTYAFVLSLTVVGSEFLHGGFAYLDDVYFKEEKAYKILTLPSECKCREVCMKEEKCIDYQWFNPTPDFVMCWFSNVTYGRLDLATGKGKRVALKLDQFKFVGPDGRTYYKHFVYKGFEDTKKVCKAVRPRFRIGVYKTVNELEVLNFVIKNEPVGIWTALVAINGEKDDPDNGRWPDGTFFNESEIAKDNQASIEIEKTNDIVRFRNKNVFDDIPDITKPLLALCQSQRR